MQDQQDTEPQAQPISKTLELQRTPGTAHPQAMQASSAVKKGGIAHNLVPICIFLVALGIGGATYALVKRYTNNVPTTSSKKTVVGSILLDRTLLRYTENAAYEKDGSGATKTTTNADGSTNFVRKKSFVVTIEKNGFNKDITLDDKTISFGATADNKFFALSCTVPALGAVGGNDATYTAQLYSTNGTKTNAITWKQQSVTAPASDDTCQYSQGSFNVVGTRFDLSSRGYGREAVDALNYKVVYAKLDGTKQDVDTETLSDIDVPLGVSPDKKVFMYNRISAKQSLDGCTESIALSYKIPDFSGPINELHAYNLATKLDTLVGTDKSLSAPSHEIVLDTIGYFSTDSSRYYLREGGHGGCRGGDSKPIRIAYIDLKTNSLAVIGSPEGKQYSGYCFTENGAYALEYGALDYFNGATPALEPGMPSILDTSTGKTYEATDKNLGCDYATHANNRFVGFSKITTIDKNNYPQDKLLLGLSVFSPNDKTSRSITFKIPLELDTHSINFTSFSAAEDIGYINRIGNYDSHTSIATPVPTLIFDLKSGNSQEVPYAQVVL